MAFSDIPSSSGRGRSDTPQGVPPVAALYRLLNGYLIGRTVQVVAQLGVADVLRDGPRSTAEIATAVGAHAPTLYRLLRALASVGLFTEVEHGSFALTSVGDCLRSDVPVSLRALISLFGSDFYLQTFDHFLQAVQTGTSPFKPAFGQPFYAYIGQHPDMGALFDEGMSSVSSMVNPAVLAAYDFSSIRTLVEVGGGQGALLVAILHANPAMRGILFDLPRVSEAARARIAAEGLADRCAVIEGDMFAGVPEGADAYLIKNALIDMSDAQVVAVLQNFRQAMSRQGRLVVIDPVIPPDDQSGGHPAQSNKFLDLVEFLLTEGGRGRTRAEFQALFASAGFALTKVVATTSTVSIVEGEPA